MPTEQAELLCHGLERMQARLPYALVAIQEPVVVPVGEYVQRKLRP